MGAGTGGLYDLPRERGAMAAYEGGCHCGRIAFVVEGEIDQLYECNCSICSKRGALHWFVRENSFA